MQKEQHEPPASRLQRWYIENINASVKAPWLKGLGAFFLIQRLRKYGKINFFNLSSFFSFEIRFNINEGQIVCIFKIIYGRRGTPCLLPRAMMKSCNGLAGVERPELAVRVTGLEPSIYNENL